MEVILRESIHTLGKAGDIVKVANGYARNFLLPKGKALSANRKNLTQMERQCGAILARAAKDREEFGALATQLERIQIEISVRAGEEDRLYGSVTSMDIAKAIESKGYTVDRRKIQLEEPIKTLGEFQVPIRLNPDVTAAVKVNVVRQES
jgi:large subunit ribosomal protein L9